MYIVLEFYQRCSEETIHLEIIQKLYNLIKEFVAGPQKIAKSFYNTTILFLKIFSSCFQYSA